MGGKTRQTPRPRLDPNLRSHRENKLLISDVPSPVKAAIEMIAARHGQKQLRGALPRPEFYVTSDLRATSDPLWQSLAKFRRRLMDGGKYTPAEWHELLLDIRETAHEVGLRPQFYGIEWIVATLSEMQEGDPEGGWGELAGAGIQIVTLAYGPAGAIDQHNLLDGFVSKDGYKRRSAIEWAEGWMNARERQLVGSERTSEHAHTHAQSWARPTAAPVLDDLEQRILGKLVSRPLRPWEQTRLADELLADRRTVGKRLTRLAQLDSPLVVHDGRGWTVTRDGENCARDVLQ